MDCENICQVECKNITIPIWVGPGIPDETCCQEASSVLGHTFDVIPMQDLLAHGQTKAVALGHAALGQNASVPSAAPTV